MVDNPTSGTHENNAATTSKDGKPIIPVGLAETKPEQIGSAQGKAQAGKTFHPIERVKSWWYSPNRRWNKPKGERAKWTDKAIVILTGGIVFLAFMQWLEMHQSGKQTDKIICADQRLADAMERSANQAVIAGQLQVRLARLAHHTALVNLTPWLGVYYEGSKHCIQGCSLFTIVAVHNEMGESGASDIQVAARMELRDSTPNDSDYDMANFGDVSPTTSLPAHESGRKPFTNVPDPKGRPFESYRLSSQFPMSKPITLSQPTYKDTHVYVWGKIRYKDISTEWAPDVRFCRYIPIDAIIATHEGTNGGNSADNNCKPNQPKPN